MVSANHQEELIREILQSLGEDPNREGLRETPQRVVKSWKEIYAGYGADLSSIFKIFTEVENYNQLIICEDIELYSVCEHHMVPFYGKAHVAYLPDKKVIGISKLARLVDVYARRLQIQERIGQQVTAALMEHLRPRAAACIIQARHMCMCMRGVNKQNSRMKTASLAGEFLEDAVLRNELYKLLKLR